MSEVKQVHVLFFVDNKRWASRHLFHVPRAGDKVRFHDDKYFTVTSIVWPMDEKETPYFHHERCNIELNEVE